MPFQKGNKLSVGHKRNTDHNGEALERLLLFLTCGGSQRMQNILEQEDDDKFREDFKALLEFTIPKKARQELTGKDGKDLLQLTPQQEAERVNLLLDELHALRTSPRIRESNGQTQSLLSVPLYSGLQADNETTPPANM